MSGPPTNGTPIAGKPRDDGADRFTSLTDVHAEIYAAFVEHQVALLHRDLPLARERLASFRARIERHIAAEEELFDTVFAHMADVSRTDNRMGRAPVDLFTGEHKHFREMLADFEQYSAELDLDDPDLDVRVIELLEAEATFKTFFRHHDEREKNLLYPALDERVPPADRAELLRRFHRTEEAPSTR